MIISHKHKFIFLKTNKTAGTSVEVALSKFCGVDDIITPISERDEVIRKDLGYLGPRNYSVPLNKYSVKDWAKLILRGEKQAYFNHISAYDVRRLIGPKIWNSYFKFCIVRNPWDLVISKYYWHYKSEPRPPISEFLGSWAVENLKRRGYGIYTIDGKVVVDRLCRYENLSEEINDVCRNALDIQEEVSLPRTKSNTRTDKRHYQDILTPEDKYKIQEIFGDEISVLGYEF